MIHDEIKVKIIALCSDIFRNSGVDTDILEYVDFSDDLGMDSITFITLIVEIESAFDITVPDDLLLIDNFRNIDAVIKIVAEQLKEKSKEQEENSVKVMFIPSDERHNKKL